MELTVSEPMAQFFMDQCVGDHNGHMAAIANNPVIMSVCKAHGVSTKEDFARFLRQVADQLTKEQPF